LSGNPVAAAADGACSVANDDMRLIDAAFTAPPEAAARNSLCTAAMGMERSRGFRLVDEGGR
jgi:hypothetical protein